MSIASAMSLSWGNQDIGNPQFPFFLFFFFWKWAKIFICLFLAFEVPFSDIFSLTSFYDDQYKNKYIEISNFFFFQPKSEDEEGWKKFCLGERLCAEGALGPSTNESPGIDYVQVGDDVDEHKKWQKCRHWLVDWSSHSLFVYASWPESGSLSSHRSLKKKAECD